MTELLWCVLWLAVAYLLGTLPVELIRPPARMVERQHEQRWWFYLRALLGLATVSFGLVLRFVPQGLDLTLLGLKDDPWAWFALIVGMIAAGWSPFRGFRMAPTSAFGVGGMLLLSPWATLAGILTFLAARWARKPTMTAAFLGFLLVVMTHWSLNGTHVNVFLMFLVMFLVLIPHEKEMDEFLNLP